MRVVFVCKCVECLQMSIYAYMRMICEMLCGLLLTMRDGGSSRASPR